MASLKDSYLDEITAYIWVVPRRNSVLDASTKRKIWATVEAEIRLSAATDSRLTAEEKEEIYNVLNRQVL